MHNNHLNVIYQKYHSYYQWPQYVLDRIQKDYFLSIKPRSYRNVDRSLPVKRLDLSNTKENSHVPLICFEDHLHNNGR